MRHVLFNEEDCEPYLVVVEDEKVWEDTLRHFDDCGVSYSVKDISPITPGELSDKIAGRDE
jgi:hypothetical protein